MVRVVMVPWWGDRAGRVGSCIGVHIVTMIVIVIQVRMNKVG